MNRSMLRATTLASLILFASAPPAHAAWPGHNGRIAFGSDRDGGGSDVWDHARGRLRPAAADHHARRVPGLVAERPQDPFQPQEHGRAAAVRSRPAERRSWAYARVTT